MSASMELWVTELAQRPPRGRGDRNKVFPDETTAVVAVDRLVHYATFLKMNVERYRQREALEKTGRKRGRPASFVCPVLTEEGRERRRRRCVPLRPG